MEIQKGTGPIALNDLARLAARPTPPPAAPAEPLDAPKAPAGDSDGTLRKTGPLSASRIELGDSVAKVAKDLITAAQEAGEVFENVGQTVQGIARTRQSGGGGLGEFQ